MDRIQGLGSRLKSLRLTFLGTPGWAQGSIILALSFILISVLDYFKLVQYEDGMDSINNIFMSPILQSNRAFFEFPSSAGKWVLLGNGIGLLYSLAPIINWYSAATLFLYGAITVLFYSCLRLHLDDSNQNPSFYVFLLLLFTVLFFFENFAVIQYTRLSYFLCFFGLLNSFLFLLKLQRLTLLSLLGCLFFVIGLLIRFEAALLSAIVLTPYIIYTIRYSDIKIKEALTLVSIPAFATLIVLGIMTLSNGLNEDVRLYNRFLHNADGNRYKHYELNMDNPKDSAAYAITLTYFMNDPDNINPQFIERIGLCDVKTAGTLLDLLTDTDRFIVKLKRQGLEAIRLNSGLILFCFLAFLSSILTVSNKMRVLKTVSMLLLWILFFGITGYMKMENRVFSPLFLSASILLIFSLESKRSLAVNQKILNLALFVLLSVAIYWQYSSVYQGVTELKSRNSEFENELKRSSSISSKYLVIDSKAMSSIYGSPMEVLPKKFSKEILAIDNGLLFLFPAYKQKMTAHFGSDKLSGVFNRIQEKPNDFLFIAQQDRMIRLLEYFNHQLQMNLSIQPLEHPNEPNNHNDKDFITFRLAPA